MMRAILVMTDQPEACPECGVRLEITDTPVDHDGQGPIFAGVCRTHGTWLVQDETETEQETT